MAKKEKSKSKENNGKSKNKSKNGKKQKLVQCNVQNAKSGPASADLGMRKDGFAAFCATLRRGDRWPRCGVFALAARGFVAGNRRVDIVYAQKAGDQPQQPLGRPPLRHDLAHEHHRPHGTCRVIGAVEEDQQGVTALPFVDNLRATIIVRVHAALDGPQARE